MKKIILSVLILATFLNADIVIGKKYVCSNTKLNYTVHIQGVTRDLLLVNSHILLNRNHDSGYYVGTGDNGDPIAIGVNNKANKIWLIGIAIFKCNQETEI